ncbi:magnesium Mg(2+) and cobalt Co(2+) transport protein CorA [Sphaerochaeta pleomorpha str. Grapes]|uniref:Magnesium transport protein CorA n=1 Tax=Sphaerochaeta pleomorpha (strain ATCC BAA-1885 / DSM 22778 / Grapes) TaxID=158190 RepID=G8QY96_SPHPG|nr:magnesium/cobalt transporter CorA [Sphaerochaeta pleomorpha]AEV29661.1 magnesium Mg(2+) and cobalt Co(2+) transport protein CorA [Sphaerochaeta pleomorpha str. Grapes]
MPEWKKFTSVHKQKEGLSPGTLVYVGDTESEETVVVTHFFNENDYICSKGMEEPVEGKRTWVQISGLSDIRTIAEIGKRYNISNLSLEDALSTDQRPKIEFASTYFFITMRILDTPDKTEEQISFFVGKDWLVSISEHTSDVLNPVIKQLGSEDNRLRSSTPDRLVHALTDRIADQYLVRADELDMQTEALEELVVNQAEKVTASMIHRHKRAILHLRRISMPLKELFNTLSKGETPFVSASSVPFFRDTFDHVLWLSEECETLRDTSQGLMEVYISSLDMKMNRIMKVLTIISTIFIPITFITGMYGMNFIHMPYITKTAWGFSFVIGFCIVLSIWMIFWFKKKKWW